MNRYIVRRLLVFIPTMLFVVVVAGVLIRLVPGNAVALMLGMDASRESMEALAEQLGLNLPFWQWLTLWFGRALRGNLGDSIFLHVPVTSLILERYPVTLGLTGLAMVVAVLVGVPAGVVAAIKQGSVIDWVAMVLTMVVMSVPPFWLALNLIIFFAVQMGVLPVGGYVPFGTDPGRYFRHMLLPAVSLGLGDAALIARMTRSSTLEVLRMDYVRTAKAKGLQRHVVIIRHALRNALVPIITVVGLSVGTLLGGAVVTETVYNLPGVGRLIIEGIKRRDYAVVQGVLLAITSTYLLVNLLVDVIYVWADPRIRYR